MDLKEVFSKLEDLEDGQEIMTVIKSELSKVRTEAATSRVELSNLKSKQQELLRTLGAKEDEDPLDSAQKIKATLDNLAKTGKSPAEVPEYLQTLIKQVEATSKQVADITKTAEAEKARRIETLKNNKLISALTTSKAVDPGALAKILADNVFVKEDGETVFYKDGDAELSVEEGAASWLKSNPWAVSIKQEAGGGANTTGSKNVESDAFVQGFEQK